MSANVLWTKRNSWPLCDGPDVAGAFQPVKIVGEGAFGIVLMVRKVLGPGRGSVHARGGVRALFLFGVPFRRPASTQPVTRRR